MNVKLLLKRTANWRVFILAAFITSLSVLGVSAFENYAPTVSSDKDDYAPGEVAIITGYGWTQDQFVDVHFEETPAYHAEHQHDYHGIEVAADGTWRIEYQIEERHLGVAFDVHVVGKQTGAQAHTYFTDANISAISPSSGCSNGGYNVTITTKNAAFNKDAPFKVFFGSIDAGLATVIDDKNIRISVPASTSAGEVSITVKNKSGGEGSSNVALSGEKFTYTSTGAPVASATQTFCSADAPKVSSLTATGSNLQWYSMATGGTALASTAALSSGNYYVSQTTTGCESARTLVAVTVNTTLDAPVLTVINNCDGTSTITAKNAAGNNIAAAELAWSNSATGNPINVTATTAVTATRTMNSCTSANSNSVTPAPKTAPTKPTITAASSTSVCPGSSVVLSSSSANGNQWFKGGVAIVGATNQTYTASENGAYTVTVTNNGCTSSVSDAITVTVEDKTAPALAAGSTLPGGSNINVCKSAASAAPSVADIAALYTDNCGGAVTAALLSSSVTGTDASWTATYTYSIKDASNNAATNAVVTYTGGDKTAPVVPTLANVTGECSATATAPTTTDNCGGTITGTTTDALTYNTQGTHTITWSFNDGNGNTSTATQKVIVKDVTAPTISAPATVTIVANASCTATGVVLGNATTADNCSVASVTNNAPTSFPLGNTTVTWTVTDGVGLTATATQTVTVTNTAPMNIVISGPVDPIQLNSSVTLNATFTDNNIKTATWDWGYKNSTGAAVVTNQNISVNTSTASHTYPAAGVYTVTLTLVDHCNSIATNSFEYVVIYDPNGGFVTGGGWIDSPAGAFKANPSLTGKANFGFNTKYKKGSTVPDGQTQFQFHAGDINFHSSIYDDMRLVISGAKANYKGVGTINGSGNYGFMVSAIDGQVTGGGGVDKFRIRIWDKNNSDAVVYDNNIVNIDENAEPATAIGGGSIVIHESKTTGTTTTTSKLSVAEPALLENTKFQNYPNPYNDRTTITFSSLKEESFALEVYDVKGALVRKVDMGVTEAGRTYSYELESRNMPEGMYFARLITASGIQTIKMVLKR